MVKSIASQSDPSPRYAVITKSDSANFAGGMCRAIYVGGAGNVVAVDADGTTCIFAAVAGGILPINAIRVNSTSTTATNMVALY